MKLIDKYIIKRLFLVFLFVLAAGTASIEMVHFVNMMDYFKCASLSAREIINYYISYSPYMLNFLSPIVSFMASVLVTLVLAGNSEIIAISSVGVPFIRLLRPYILFAILLSGMSFIFCEWIIPGANKHRIIFEINYLNRRSYSHLKDIHIKVDEDKYIYVQSYNAYTGIGSNFTLESIMGGLIGKFSAKEIKWIPSKGVWQAHDWNLRKFDGLNETLKRGYKIDLTLNLEPADFGGLIALKEMVNMRELNTFIKKLQMKKSDALYLFEVEKYARYMYPFSILLLVLIGMLFASRKMRGGAVWQLILSFILAILYLALFMFASSRAESHSENILLTLWTPNIVFSILVMLIYRFMPR